MGDHCWEMFGSGGVVGVLLRGGSLAWWLLLGFCLFGVCGVDAADSDGPILPLESVLGFKVERTRLEDRAMKGSGETKLVMEKAKASGFSVVRRWDPAYVSFGDVRFKGASGDLLVGQTVKPKSPDLPPAVILLDEEIRYFTRPGGLREDQDLDEVEGLALGRLPLASHLIANGFAVLFPAKDVLEKKGRFQSSDWQGLVEKWVKREKIDRESLFLVATFENAQMALTLSSQIRFAGVVIEAPRRMIFRDSKKEQKQGEEETVSSEFEEAILDLGVFESEAQMKRYIVTVNSQKSPVHLVASKEQIKDEMLRKSLLLAFSLTRADLRVTALDEVARRRLGDGVEAQGDFYSEPEIEREFTELDTRREAPMRHPVLAFRYEPEAFEKWVGRMINYLVRSSQNKPLRIPEPQRGSVRREGGRGGSPFSDVSEFGGGDENDGGGGQGGDGGE